MYVEKKIFVFHTNGEKKWTVSEISKIFYV